ncbi:sarcosine oxidase subunit gamma [Jannaschia sp. M317]|uniref:sarcosine oxidase subunit gamma n=1 Tax=Jannaschia sp. M317 TaxID=2867011 RepID=UPI0021A5B154|nr:sarcosine oxidase subunit gamma [Jannaschia sp. M317]UWQ19294.1 sarcosine oxidase subunit gamma [Jannaschia sp. M317]
MRDLTPLCALGTTAPRIDTIRSLTLTERLDLALASVTARRGRVSDTRAAITALIETDAPAPGRIAGGPLRAIWTGPDQWLIEAPFATHENIEPILRVAVADAATIVEQTDAWVRFDLAGDDVVPVLERLSNLDHGRMTVGSATFTTIHHLRCLLLRDKGRVVLYGPRASAQSLHHAVLTAMGAV